MKFIEVVEKYISEGHSVTYRKRPDGGIIITSVDGMKFPRAGTGNKYLRQVTGINVSAKRMAQTTYNVGKFIKLKAGQHKASSLSDTEELKRLTRRVQRIWRKNQTTGEGKVTIRKVRWLQQQYGTSVAKEYLLRRERYSLGYAYEENVNYWAEVISRMGSGTQYDSDFKELAEKLRSKIDHVKEADLQKIHDIQYNGGIPLEEKLRQIKEIIESM